MNWLTSPDATSPALPAAWLIATEQRPATLKERSTLRRSMALRIMMRQFSLPRDAIEIGHDPSGRPFVQHPAGTGLHISLATRSGLVAVALANRPVGVDVERIDPTGVPPLGVLHEGEREALLALPDFARALTFAEIWTGKEAYVKALGTGFLRPPESFRVGLVTRERFDIADPEQQAGAIGHSRIIKNGGQDSLAAAVVVLA